MGKIVGISIEIVLFKFCGSEDIIIFIFEEEIRKELGY